MNLLQLNQYAGILTAIGLLVFALTTIYYQRKLGLSKTTTEGLQVSGEVVTAYKEQVQQLRDELAKERDLRSASDAQIEGMKVTIDNQNKKIAELTLLLTGKSPAQEEYNKTVMQFLMMAGKFIERSDKREEQILKLVKRSN